MAAPQSFIYYIANTQYRLNCLSELFFFYHINVILKIDLPFIFTLYIKGQNSFMLKGPFCAFKD